MGRAIGIDIGGGNTKFGRVSDSREILARAKLAAIPGDAIAEGYVAAITRFLPQDIDTRGVGIGYVGPIHPGNLSGRVGSAVP